MGKPRGSDPFSSFVDSRRNPQDPLSKLLESKRQGDGQGSGGPKKPRGRVRGRRIGSPTRMRFLHGWGEACGRFSWDTKVGKVERTATGTRAEVRFIRRNAAVELERYAPELSGIFGIRATGVQIVPDEHNAQLATVHLLKRDLLIEQAGAPWPGLTADALSLWDPIEFGWDQFGAPVRLSVMGRHMLVAGETGSGKSVAQSMIVATAALSDARMFLMDANEIQLARWRAVAEEFIVDDMKRAGEVLDYLLDEVARRNSLITAQGLDKLGRDSGEPPLFLVIDEGADFLRMKDFTTSLTRLCARARAAGVCVLFATQSPNATIIPTPLRNNLGLRAVFRVADKSASQVALGTSAVDASLIAPEHRGVCFLHQDGAVPSRMRTFYPTPEQVRELCARAVTLRGISVTP